MFNVKSNDKDITCCCGCFVGLLIGYYLGSSDAKASEVSPTNYASEQPKIEQVIESTQLANFLLRQIEHYQRNISPKIRERLKRDRLCKFEPSCSEYARQAIEKYGSTRGSLMATNRLLRCNPLNKGGYDPVG